MYYICYYDIIGRIFTLFSIIILVILVVYLFHIFISITITLTKKSILFQNYKSYISSVSIASTILVLNKVLTGFK